MQFFKPFLPLLTLSKARCHLIDEIVKVITVTAKFSKSYTKS